MLLTFPLPIRQLARLIPGEPLVQLSRQQHRQHLLRLQQSGQTQSNLLFPLPSLPAGQAAFQQVYLVILGDNLCTETMPAYQNGIPGIRVPWQMRWLEETFPPVMICISVTAQLFPGTMERMEIRQQDNTIW